MTQSQDDEYTRQRMVLGPPSVYRLVPCDVKCNRFEIVALKDLDPSGTNARCPHFSV
jgi:hypothetical protein